MRAESDKELMEHLEQMLSVMRHELGNRVNSLKITLDVLQENYDRFDDVKKREYLKRASALLARQEKLVEAMKSYSRFHSNKREEISLLHFWEHFLSLVSGRLKGGNISVNHNMEVEPCLIKADKMALEKALTNILDNSIEALEDVNDPEIALTARRANGSVIILIKDNGPGIRERDINKILVPLYTGKPGKTGMGLPIARRLLVEMDARLEIRSLINEGTEVRVWLESAGLEQKKTVKHEAKGGGR